MSSSSSSEVEWVESGESAGGRTLSRSDEEPEALPLSFDRDSGSAVEAINAAVRTPFHSQIKLASVDSRNGVIKGSARRIVVMVTGFNGSSP